jgi:hypothetical protein
VRDDPEDIAAGLTDLDDMSGVWELIETADPEFVADLGIALRRLYGDLPERPWQYRSVFDQLLQRLAAAPAGPVLRLIAAGLDRHHTARVAALMAAAGPVVAGPAAVPDDERFAELRACLAHESVLRGHEAPASWVHPAHALAWLPLALTPVETTTEQRDLNAGTAPRGGVLPRWRETTNASRAMSMSAAFAGWESDSNGRVEARTFVFDAVLEPGSVAAALAQLDLDSTHGLEAGLQPYGFGRAWRSLFASASGGGAYHPGAFGAYGRLAAWRSVAGLAGAPDDATFPQVVALAASCGWYSFAGATTWFDRVAWDIGLAVLTPDGRGLAVLAATDTD